MPDLVGLLANRNAPNLAAAGFIKQAQLDLLGVFGEKCEVYSFSVPAGPQGIGLTRPDDQISCFEQRGPQQRRFDSREKSQSSFRQLA
jgi:hypothetical protein